MALFVPASFSLARAAEPLPVLEMHLLQRTALIDNLPVAFQPREVRLLELLVDAHRQWLSIDSLCVALVGQASPLKRHLLSQYVYCLRRKLGRFGSCIEFVRGEGYRCLLDVNFVNVAAASNQ